MTHRPKLAPKPRSLTPSLAIATLLCLACHDGRGGQGPDDGGPAPIESEGTPPNDGDTSQAPPGYPGELISTDEMSGDFMARQKLSGRYGEEKFAFEAVLQLRGGTLTVLGLTPFGGKAFVLEQTGAQVDFRALIDREMPFPPEYILQDVQRAWLWHARLPWGDGPPNEEQPSVEIAGERVSEQWLDGQLVRRSFERIDGEPTGTIRVDYIGGHRVGRLPPKVVLDNGWFGYRLEIETLEWRSLD